MSRSVSRMFLQMLATVLPRQSVSVAISSSIRSDGFIGSSYLDFLSSFHATSFAAASEPSEAASKCRTYRRVLGHRAHQSGAARVARPVLLVPAGCNSAIHQLPSSRGAWKEL